MKRAALIVAACLVVAPAAVAVSPPVVVIDPGHDLFANPATEPIGPGSATMKIKDGGGTHGVVSGVREADLVLAVSLRLRRLLEGAGLRVVMTRTKTAGKGMGNIARARIANRAHASLFLRVHADGSETSSARGTSVLVPDLHAGWTDEIYDASRRAGAFLLAETSAALDFPRRGVVERSDFTGFNWADVPVALVELGFMTNPVEDRRLDTPAGRAAAARGLCRGTLRFLGRSPSACG